METNQSRKQTRQTFEYTAIYRSVTLEVGLAEPDDRETFVGRANEPTWPRAVGGSHQAPSPNQSTMGTQFELFFWEARGSNIGHLSLYLPGNFLYVSFWPSDEMESKAVKSVKSKTQTYDDDFE